MRTHTQAFKDGIKEYGRQFNDIIYHNGNTYDGERINSVNYTVDTNLMKSVMQTLKIDTDIPVAKGDTLDYGISLEGVTGSEIRFNNFIVDKVDDQKDKNSNLIICYDNMIKTMVDYVNPEITYPVTVREYINAICTHLGITFKNASSIFTNYNISINREHYLDEEGNSLGYTFRDVLDDLAEATGSFICIDNAGELEIRFVTNTNDTIDEEYFKDKNVTVGAKFGPINSIVLSRIGEDNIYRKDDESIEENGLCEIKITDNELLNDNDREDFIDGIWDELNGLEFYLNDFATTGILYYEAGDKFDVSIGETTYPCLMLNDNIRRTTGLIEKIHTAEPKTSVTDYKKADTTDRKLNQTYLIVDKQEGKITSLSSRTDVVESNTSELSNQIITTNDNLTNLNDDLQTYKQTVATQFTQTNEDFTFRFDNVTDLINQVSDTENEHYSELHNYIRFVNGVIILGQEGNPFTAELSNTELAFKQNGTTVAYVSNNKLNITNADITTQLDLGNFQFKPRNNGSLSFGKKG